MGTFAISANSFTCQNLDLGSMTTSHPLQWHIKTICCTAGSFGEEGIRAILLLHNHNQCDPPHSMNSVQEVSSKESIWLVQRVMWTLTLVLRICRFCPSRSRQRTWQGNLRDEKKDWSSGGCSGCIPCAPALTTSSKGHLGGSPHRSLKRDTKRWYEVN